MTVVTHTRHTERRQRPPLRFDWSMIFAPVRQADGSEQFMRAYRARLRDCTLWAYRHPNGGSWHCSVLPDGAQFPSYYGTQGTLIDAKLQAESRVGDPQMRLPMESTDERDDDPAPF